MKRSIATLGVISTLSTAGLVQATEGGGSVYQPGIENFTCCAIPPPGLYGMVYGQHYSADKFRGNDGRTTTSNSFKVSASAIVPRVIWVAPTNFAGADAGGVHAMLPLVDLNVKVAPGVSQSKTGIGDMIFGPFLGWHLSPKLHTLAALDIYAPTGSYDENDLANIGRNYWALQPLVGMSYIDPHGFNADIKAMWTYNFENKDTDYKSGQELIVDYAVGWGVGGGWTIGVGGYLYRQMNDDKSNGNTVADNKGRSQAIGPSIRYDGGKGWFLTAKYQVEQSVRNRSEGSAFSIKAVFPF